MTKLVKEVIGIFFELGNVEAALKDLHDSGFRTDEIGLLAGEKTVEKSLGTLYSRAIASSDSADAPETAFVKQESLGDNFKSLAGGLVFTGITTTMGVAVASAGIFGGAALAAGAGAVGVVGIGALVGSLINRSDAEYLQEQLDNGHTLLFVRVSNSEAEKRIVEIITRHSGFDVRILEIEVEAEEAEA